MFARLGLAIGLALSVFFPIMTAGSRMDSAPMPSQVKLTLLAGGFTAITEIANAGDSRLFVVDQAGPIKIVQGGSVLPTAFLDLAGKASCCGEMGVLGLAFHPNYAANRYFYVNYTYRPTPTTLRTRVSRFTTSANDPNVADANSEQTLLEFAQPYDNHNGGSLHFGADGYLYISTGDGGSSYDPPNNIQNTSVVLGKLLRIDVNSTAGGDCNLAANGRYGIPASNPLRDGARGKCDEIWAYGLRNPWRVSFDRLTHDLWIADVGQGAREEIDVQFPGSAGGLNYGWDCKEGTLTNGTDPSPLCAGNPATVAPIYEYDHSGGKCSITGGYVYRGPSYAGFYGTYFFADYCSAEMWALKRTGGGQTVQKLTISGATLSNPRTFGEDAAGELYVASPTTVYKLTDPAAPAVAPQVSILRGSGNTVTLNWSANAADCTYEVHHGAAPYFTPDGLHTEVATVASTSPLTYSDPNGLGDPNVCNYYDVHAFNCSAISAADVNRTGEFEYGLTRGA